MDAATWWTECVDSGDQMGQGDAQTALRALCTRADAAERLAVATDALDSDDWREVDADGVPLVANEHANALAAWRSLGEVQP